MLQRICRNIYCKDDTAVNLTAPFGYQDYSWYNNAFTKVLGNQQTLTFQPPPPPGATFAVIVTPYNGYGCVDTLYARLEDTLSVKSNAGRDTLSCNQNPVPVGANSKPGLVTHGAPLPVFPIRKFLILLPSRIKQRPIYSQQTMMEAVA